MDLATVYWLICIALALAIGIMAAALLDMVTNIILKIRNAGVRQTLE